MTLTGKSKEDFYKFLIKKFPLNENEVEKWFLSLYNEFKNALIIEWFDSVGNLNNKRCVYNFKTLYLSTFKQLEKHHSILDIQKITIKKANEIYNEKYSISQ